MLIYLIQGIGYGFAAAMQPGPFQTYVISQALSRGWRRTLPAVLAPLISDGPIILLALLVLSQLPDSLASILHLASGLFVLYLARDALISWRDTGSGNSETGSSTPTLAHQSLLKAAVMNVLSPGPYVYWSLVAGPILLESWRQASGNGIGFLLGFYLAMLGGLVGIVLMFGAARQSGPKVTRALVGLSALVLLGFGLYELWLGFSALSWR